NGKASWPQTRRTRGEYANLRTKARKIPGLFGWEAAVKMTNPPVQVSRRSFNQILAETFRTYRKGFFQFLGLTLVVLLPSICSQVTTVFVQPPQGSNMDLRSVLAGGFAFLMFILSIVMWPVYVAGIQILTAEIAGGRRPRLVAVLNEAVKYWPRVAALCIFVNVVFALLTLFGLGIGLIALVGMSSVLLTLAAMGLLVLQVWM